MNALSVAENNKYLEQINSSGEKAPFFWLGDTAWLMFSKLSLLEAKDYFLDRKSKHFNVIQAVLVYGTCKEDIEGSSLPIQWDGSCNAVLSSDFSKIDFNSGYWNKVDKMIDIAEKCGLYIGLLPVWGSMVKKGYLNEENAESYGEFLGKRYGNRNNIIWILGGDVRGNIGTQIWNNLACSIKANNVKKQLMTFHPFGRTSSAMWFHESNWLDINMFQSGHRRYDQNTLGMWDDNNVSEDFYGEDNWRYVKRELDKSIIKPVLDGEPSYEQIPQGLHDEKEPYWEAKDVRRYAYWSIFQGACGHTYGHNAIQQIHSEIDTRSSYGVKEYWHEAISAEGSISMKILYEFFTKYDYTNGCNSQELLAEESKNRYERIAVFSGEDYAMFYNYTGRSFYVDKQLLFHRLKTENVSFQWFDPKSGDYQKAEYNNIDSDKTFKNVQVLNFNPPEQNKDWILVIENL